MAKFIETEVGPCAATQIETEVGPCAATHTRTDEQCEWQSGSRNAPQEHLGGWPSSLRLRWVPGLRGTTPLDCDACS